MICNLKDKRKSELLKHYNEAKDDIDVLKLGFENIDKKIENEQQILATCLTEASETQIMLEVQKVKNKLNEHKSFISSQSIDIKEYNLVVKKTPDICRNLEKAFEVILEHSKSQITPKSYNTDILAVNRFGIIQPFWESKGVDAICFRVSKDIKLHGLLSYGCTDGRSICKVSATLKDDTKELTVISKNLDSKEAESGLLKIFFPKPVILSKNKKYHLVVDMEGPEYQYGNQGKSSIKQNGIEFNFEKSQYSNLPTDTTRGQIPGFLFSVI